MPVPAAPPPPPPAPAPPIWEEQTAEAEAIPEAEMDELLNEDEPGPGEPEELIPAQPPVSIEAPIKPAPEIKKPAMGPRLIVPKKKPVVVKEPMTAAMPVEKAVQAKQEVMQFEPVTRGRFEKSEPTIVEGQDLDVPTYLRKNIRVK
jgi:cell division protein FtsZ